MKQYTRVVITGFMGAGKSSIGKILAAKLSWLFFDTDAMAETTEGIPVSKIFSVKGEAHFRKLEKRCFEGLMTLREVVIATGGGTLINPECFSLLDDETALICLWASEDELKKRLTRDHTRPLLEKGYSSFFKLLQERKPAYEKMGYQLDTTGMSPNQVCEKILVILNENNKKTA